LASQIGAENAPHCPCTRALAAAAAAEEAAADADAEADADADADAAAAAVEPEREPGSVGGTTNGAVRPVATSTTFMSSSEW
jgi:hypothetical protein